MPLPAVIVVVGLLVVVVAPIRPTQTLTSDCIVLQSLPTVGFHLIKSARLIFW
jgi:hypothetical protein